MADNESTGSGKAVATDKVTYSGDADQNVQLVRFVQVTGAEGAKTVVDLPGDAGNGVDVDVTRVPADPFGADADAANAAGSISAKLRFIATTGVPITGTPTVIGNVAHDGADAGNPVKVGYRAVSYVAQTGVAAGDRHDALCDRHGVQFVVGGHPDVITLEAAYTAAQTDTALVTISAGQKIVVTQVMAVTDNANTAFPQIRLGFGAANTPTTTGVVFTHPGLPAGGGASRGSGAGILGVGGDGEDLRVTCGAPTGGSLRVLVSYYLIDG